jgi:hypothetical protein
MDGTTGQRSAMSVYGGNSTGSNGSNLLLRRLSEHATARGGGGVEGPVEPAHRGERAVQPGEPLPRRALDSRHRLSLINSISRSVDRPSPFGRGSHQR